MPAPAQSNPSLRTSTTIGLRDCSLACCACAAAEGMLASVQTVISACDRMARNLRACR
jgi:hypothetical protein